MSNYTLGTDVLIGEQVLTVHFTDLPGLIQSQGGSTGSAALRLMPNTVINKTYTETQSKIAAGLADQGAKAEVKIVPFLSLPTGERAKGKFITGAIIGSSVVAAGGIGLLVWKLLGSPNRASGIGL